MFEYTKTGMKFTTYLMGSLGAGFILFPDPEHTESQIKAAQQELRSSRDVAHLRIASEDDRDDIYRRQIYAQPEIRPLRWFQINTEHETIRRERLQGTSASAYVQTYVLPFIKQTEEMYFKRFGPQIYEI